MATSDPANRPKERRYSYADGIAGFASDWLTFGIRTIIKVDTYINSGRCLTSYRIFTLSLRHRARSK